MEKNEWRLYENDRPENTGWYDCQDQNGNTLTCPYSVTLSGREVWVVPDGVTIIRWREVENWEQLFSDIANGRD